MSSRCWKKRGTGPSKAKGRTRQRGTETQREAEDRGSEGGGGRDPEGRGTETQGRNSSQDQKKTHRTTDWGTGAPCHQESQNKGPRRPLPQFPTTPIRGGAGQRRNRPLAPPTPPPLTPPPGPWAGIQLKFPVTFRRPGTGENFFQYRSRLPGGSTSSTAFPGP